VAGRRLHSTWVDRDRRMKDQRMRLEVTLSVGCFSIETLENSGIEPTVPSAFHSLCFLSLKAYFGPVQLSLRFHIFISLPLDLIC